jgi:hypothetical protein
VTFLGYLLLLPLPWPLLPCIFRYVHFSLSHTSPPSYWNTVCFHQSTFVSYPFRHVSNLQLNFNNLMWPLSYICCTIWYTPTRFHWCQQIYFAGSSPRSMSDIQKFPVPAIYQSLRSQYVFLNPCLNGGFTLTVKWVIKSFWVPAIFYQ